MNLLEEKVNKILLPLKIKLHLSVATKIWQEKEREKKR